MKKIYLVRHGHTEESELICYRENQVPLSGEGRRQACRLADFFRGKELSAIYSSPYRRAAETAGLLGGGKEIRQEESFREIDMGLWQGKSFKEIKALWPDEYEDRGLRPLDFCAPEGESFRTCLERAKDALLRICREEEGDIIVVSHSGVIRVLLWDLMGKDEQELFGIKQDFAAVNILTYDHAEEKLRAESINMTV